VKVVWLPGAIDDLQRLEAFLAQHAEVRPGEAPSRILNAARERFDAWSVCAV
jgi:hypothetical protein